MVVSQRCIVYYAPIAELFTHKNIHIIKAFTLDLDHYQIYPFYVDTYV